MIPFRKRGRFALAAIAISAATAAHGAEPPPAATDPGRDTAPPVYRSAFEGYLKFRPGPVSSWKGANDTVGAVGGHVGALKGAPAASPAAASPPATAPEAPAPKAVPVKPVTGGAGHLGHH